VTDTDSPLEIARQLIQIPSQNAMGHARQGTLWSEQAISRWLCDFFARHNVIHRYDEIESGRGNVVAWLPGRDDAPTVLLDAHQDTVPTEGMTIEPFSPVVKDGRLFGRGACDVKGPMASILAVVARLAKQPDRDGAGVIVSLTCDEEFGQLGAIDLAKRLGTPSDVLPRTPDMAIVAEPTSLNAVVAHKGVLRWRIQTDGVAVHSSRPSAGRNAIYAMADVVAALRDIASELEASGPKHPLCGGPTLIVGTIHGGQSVNIVPDSCLIEIDRRLVPGESADVISKDIETQLRRRTDSAFRMLPPDTVCGPLVDDDNRNLADQLTGCARDVCGTSETIGVAYTTHAPKFAAAGIPTVVFGPGSIDQAHTEDEWIEIEQLDQSAEILQRFVSTI
jgi:acetylornithine deacetylase